MDQMNVSITEHLADYVRKKVKSGRYNNASEVVRDALRRMADEDARDLSLVKPSVDDLLTDLTQVQLDGIRERVRTSIRQIEAGDFKEYEGSEGLKQLGSAVKQRGRKLLDQESSRQ
jgi:putative addiction module CopG family antidote